MSFLLLLHCPQQSWSDEPAIDIARHAYKVMVVQQVNYPYPLSAKRYCEHARRVRVYHAFPYVDVGEREDVYLCV